MDDPWFFGDAQTQWSYSKSVYSVHHVWGVLHMMWGVVHGLWMTLGFLVMHKHNGVDLLVDGLTLYGCLCFILPGELEM
jgi:hypothetical protein